MSERLSALQALLTSCLSSSEAPVGVERPESLCSRGEATDNQSLEEVILREGITVLHGCADLADGEGDLEKSLMRQIRAARNDAAGLSRYCQVHTCPPTRRSETRSPSSRHASHLRPDGPAAYTPASEGDGGEASERAAPNCDGEHGVTFEKCTQ